MQLTKEIILVTLCFTAISATSVTSRIENETQKQNMTNDVSPRNELVVIDGKPYFIGLEPKLTFKAAMQTCQNLGMTLVSLETLEKHNQIYIFLFTYDTGERDYWTSGMRYLANSRDWVWTSRGHQITWFNWANNQPGNDEQCILLRVHAVDGWHDARCEESTSSYVCEYPCN